MNALECEVCFICDKNINKGICLGVEKTNFTKTSFPTKLQQLLGDSFMVVVSEEDKLCMSCANLINRTDKLEEELIDIKNTIIELLNVKYDLDREKDYTLSEPEIEECNGSNGSDNISVMSSPPLSVISQMVEEYLDSRSSDFAKESKDYSLIDSSDLEIKSEPVQLKCSVLSGNSTHHYTQKGDQTITESSPKKLIDDDPLYEEKPLTLQPTYNKEGTVVQGQQGMILREVKIENLSSDDKLDDCVNFSQSKIIDKYLNKLKDNNDKASSEFIVKNKSQEEKSHVSMNQHSANNTSVENLHSVKYDIVPDLKLLSTEKCDQQVAEEIEISSRVEPMNKIIKIHPKRYLKPKSLKNKLNTVPPRKLRPILPKISNGNQVLSTICVIPNSQYMDSNESLNKNLIGPNDEFVRTIKIENNVNDSFSLNHNIISSPKQCILLNTKVTNIVEIDQEQRNESTYCKLCKEYLIDSEKHKCQSKPEDSSEQEKYKCSYCARSFKSKSGHKSHEAKHTGKYTFCCDFCGQGFLCQGHLEEHRRGHTKEERYVCDVCGKKFNYQSTLWIHRKWHDNPFPYKCTDCNRPFRHSSLLAVHRRKHTGERPYKCSYCPYTFTVGASLKKHLILHTKEYPFKCDICNHGYTTRIRFTEHLAKKHNLLVDKPSTDPKDYKMAIHNSEIEKCNSDKLSALGIDLQVGQCSNKDIENSVTSFSDESSKSHCQNIELVLASSSVLSDNTLSLSDSWLT